MKTVKDLWHRTIGKWHYKHLSNTRHKEAETHGQQGQQCIIIIMIIIIIGFSVYLQNSSVDITQFNNKSMQKTEKFWAVV